MARKLYVICGHGAGDPGACAHGYQEAERVRALGKKINELADDRVLLADTSRNFYADNGISTLSYDPDDIWIVELHMDSAASSARGGHVIINGNYDADEWDKKLAKGISGLFPGRSVTISKRTDLANPNRAAARGYNYRLVENGFISNSTDLKIFNNNLEKLAKIYLDAFGIPYSDKQTSSKPSTSKPSTGSSGTVDVKDYAVKIKKTLNVRKGAGFDYAVVQTVKPGEGFTITHTKKNDGVTWGKLKSGAGWISLASAYSEKVTTSTAKKSITEVAKEVIAGEWGNGETRKKKLEAAGYDYEKVQAKVNELL